MNNLASRAMRDNPKAHGAPIALVPGSFIPQQYGSSLDDSFLDLLAEMRIAPDAELKCANSTSNCMEFDTQAADGSSVRLKYVGDEVEGRHPGARPDAYPRNRLASAHRCLRWLERQHDSADWFPRIHFFDESRRILAETTVSDDSHTLLSDFVVGHFDVKTAAQLGELVAKLHSTPVTENPVRGSWQEERSWWKQRRSYWYERLDIQQPEIDADDFADCGSRCMVHLNLAAENVTLRDGQVAIRAFECASSIGDPVLDVMVVLSNYLTAGAATNQRSAAEHAAQIFASSYRKNTLQGAERVRRALLLIRPCSTRMLSCTPGMVLLCREFGTTQLAANDATVHL